ncbi:ATP synthase F1 subunit epsilon [Calditrichota bacterium]
MLDGAKGITLTIVTPHGTLEEFNVSHVRLPGKEGQFGVLPGHLPFMTPLAIGAIFLDTAEGKEVWSTSGGYAEVLPDRVTILAETAEMAARIDVSRAEAARERALGRIKSLGEGLDLDRAHIALDKALNRLQIAKGGE